VSVAAFIASQRTEHGVPHAVACRALEVSQSWFYKWRDRPPTPRQQRRAELAEAIRVAFDASGGTYGSPRVTLDLWAAGWQVSENTVAKLMAELGLAGRAPKRRPKHLTKQGKRPAAPDLVNRNFSAVAPNLLWCGDLTQIDTDEGKLYLASVLDLFSRRLLGYAMSEHHDAPLACAALAMAPPPEAATSRELSSTVTAGVSTPPSCTPQRAVGWVWSSRWAGSGRRWTTPRPRRSTRSSRWSTSTGTTSARGAKQGSRSRRGSWTSTTPAGGTVPATA
jgi:Integrase core domain.